jgi:hypothetical protein
MSLLPGSPLSGSLTAAELNGLEVALRELWSVPADRLQQLAPASPERVLARVKEAVTCWQGVGIVAEAHAHAREWLAGPEPEQFLTSYAVPIVGHGDPNLSNYLWDGSRVRIVDFEDAGCSDLAVELANLVEHLAARDTDWVEFVSRFPVDPARFAAARCIWATFWLTLLRPGEPAAARNPAGAAEKQAERLITLLGSGSS